MIKNREVTVDPHNEVLANLRGIDGLPCGEEIVRRALDAQLTVLIGEPAVGKSTVRAQLENELTRRDIPVQVVTYDQELEKDIQERGYHKENGLFNCRLLRRVGEAIQQMLPKKGKVLFDTVGVGNTMPKDRSVTAVQMLATAPNRSFPLEIDTSAVGIVAPISQQYDQVQLRLAILQAPYGQVLELLANHHITLKDIPPDISPLELEMAIKDAQRKSGRPVHVAQISNEVIHQEIGPTIREIGLNTIYNIPVPNTLSSRDQHSAKFKIAGMNRRLQQYGFPENRRKAALNIATQGDVTWYAPAFLAQA